MFVTEIAEMEMHLLTRKFLGDTNVCILCLTCCQQNLLHKSLGACLVIVKVVMTLPTKIVSVNRVPSDSK